tara:strand:- start:425 stop:535 length:111 start_codon:yes stop_codon:yes gene_type:complete
MYICHELLEKDAEKDAEKERKEEDMVPQSFQNKLDE